ncbi:MAG TPA: class I SAM-dependent methyltransferase [Thermoleophilaceae bacterium]|jgi:SAM-dependent methyltransferase
MNPELFYGADLAYVHDQAFGHLARAGGETLLRMLARQGFNSGLTVELGSGSGITAQLLTEHGYDVLGVEVSPDLVEIARGRAPTASFLNASLLDAELPTCVAVAAIGECFNYAFDERAGDEALGVIFQRVHDALEPGGLFLFDIAEPGRERGGPRRDWSEGPDWTLCLEASEDYATRSLERKITVFREVDGAFRRSDELHRLRLYELQAVLDGLSTAGFEARRLGAYGSAVHFGRGHSGFLATKRLVV